MKVPYREGDVFAVPLDGGGYALGVVARCDGKGLVVGHFFAPALQSVPTLDEVQGLVGAQPVWTHLVGDLGFLDGDWVVVGPLADWRSDQWPASIFGRKELLRERYVQLEYRDLDEPPRATEISAEEYARLPQDGLAGSGAAERTLTRLLKRQSRRDRPRSQPAASQGAARFFFYFREQEAAHAAVSRLTQAGLDVVVRPSADETSWLALGTAVVDGGDELDALEERFERLAERLGGVYDGFDRDT